jgi:peptidoglycan/xylan/chitin deacetylase (PgdA/CDA1 family)
MTLDITALDDHVRRRRALGRAVALRASVVLGVVAVAFALASCVGATLGSRRSHVVPRGVARRVTARRPSGSTLPGAFAASPIPHAGIPFDHAPFLGRPVTHGDPSGRMVALTFDDGPSVDSTAVLQILEQEHAPASFFYVGDRVFGHPLIPGRAAADGFDVGDHTLHHVEMVGLTKQQMLDQVLTTNDILQRATGVRPLFFRPRSGHADAAARALVARLGMIMVLWDARDGDTDATSTVEGITRQALAQAHGGSVVLMHETNPKTVAALPGIIAGLRAKGLVPVTLSTLLAAEGAPGRSSGAAVGSVGSGARRP